MGKLIDLTGQRFGRLTVIERDTSRTDRVYWWCRCDCGNTKSVGGENLRYGNTISCGCYSREVKSAIHKKHGLRRTRIYKTWQHMKARCLKIDDDHFKWYGGRGIKVCDEWAGPECFVAFYEYVSKLEHFGENGYTLDRIDNNGNYEPGNVRWATAKEQANNQRKREIKPKTITVNGKPMTLKEISNVAGIGVDAVRYRLKKGLTDDGLLAPRKK